MESTSKRPCTVLSPLSEDKSDTKVLHLIISAVEKAISKAVPSIVAQVIVQLQSAILGAVRSAVNELKYEGYAKMAQYIELSESKKDLMTKCEAEKLETYIRKGNIK